MRRVLSIIGFCCASAVMLAPLATTRAQETASPVVVELYTSQGCSSCPPADAFLGEIAKRENVIALTLNVDYWDYLGWKDAFADPAHTERQRAYNRSLGSRVIYTPQIVVHGAQGLSGNHRMAVETALMGHSERLNTARVDLAYVNDAIKVDITPTAPSGALDAQIWLFAFDSAREQAIERGENAGRSIVYYNVVLEMRPLGEWDGQPATVSAAVSGDVSGYAVIVQRANGGPVLGAQKLMLVN